MRNFFFYIETKSKKKKKNTRKSIYNKNKINVYCFYIYSCCVTICSEVFINKMKFKSKNYNSFLS